MFHLKQNVGPAQRVVRIVAGGMMVAGGVLMLQGQTVGYILAAMGAMGLLTGLMGYCPACALAGCKASQSH